MNIEEMRKHILPVNYDEPFVFVSYSKKDAEKVYPTILELQKKGVNLWIDTNLTGTEGTSWQDNAFNVINEMNCKKILFFMSVNSFFSVPVCAELAYTINEDVINNHAGEKVNIVPISVNGGNIGNVIDDCRNTDLKEFSKKLGKEFTEIFQPCMDGIPNMRVSEITNKGGLMTIIIKHVFNNDRQITVTNNSSDGILENLRKSGILSNSIDNSESVNEESDSSQTNKNDKSNETQIENDLNNSNYKDKNVNSNMINSNYFETHKNDKDLVENEHKSLKYYDEFKSKFSPEKLKELNGLTLLRSIFLNDEGNQTNICSLFEYNKEYINFGSIKGGTALKHVLYYSAKEKSWMTGKPPVTYKKLTEQEAIELGTKIRDNIIKACEIIDKYKDKLNTEEAYEQMYNEIDTQADGIYKVLFVKKYFHMMYKDLFPCMFSTGYIRRVADIFGYEKYLDDTKYIAKFEMTKNKHGISNYLFALIVYKYFDENNTNDTVDEEEYEVSGKDYNAKYKIKGESIIVLKGSKIHYSPENTPKKIYQELKDAHLLSVDNVLQGDTEPLPRSTAGRLIKGMSTNGADLIELKQIVKK